MTLPAVPAKQPKPVALAASVSAVIPVIVGLLVTLHIVDIAPDAADGISTAAQSLVGALGTVAYLIVTVIATIKAHTKVTPLANPQTVIDGVTVPLVPAV